MRACNLHDTPNGARFCIRCGVAVGNVGATQRLDLEGRALAGEGELIVTRAEFAQLLMDARTLVVHCEGYGEIVTITRFLGRDIVIGDEGDTAGVTPTN